jgi:hypothetical protein
LRRKEESSFSEEKEAKRLLLFRSFTSGWHWSRNVKLRGNKSLFASFSSEKEESFL